MVLVFLTCMTEIFAVSVYRIFAEKTMNSRGKSFISELSAWGVYLICYNYISYKLAQNVWFNLVTSVASFYILFTFLYRDSVKRKIYMIAVLYIAGMCSELIVYSISHFILNKLYICQSITEQQIFLMGSISSKLIYFCLLKLILLFTKKNRTFEANLLDWMEAVFIPLGSIVIFFVFLPVEGAFPDEDKAGGISKVFGIAILLIINVMSYYLYEKGKEAVGKRIYAETLRDQCNYYMRQCEESQSLWMEFSKFRHDMKQKNIYFQALLDAGKYDELKAHYEDDLKFLSGKKNLSNSGNIFFDSILNYKGEIAEKDHIEFRLETEIPHDCRVNGEELSICLGNLLDNAVEAVKEVDIEKRRVHIAIKAQGYNLYIKVKNPYAGTRIRDGGSYVTTKPDAHSHGWGLQIVREIVERYHGEMKVTDDEGEFCVALLLYQCVEYS